MGYPNGLSLVLTRFSAVVLFSPLTAAASLSFDDIRPYQVRRGRAEGQTAFLGDSLGGFCGVGAPRNGWNQSTCNDKAHFKQRQHT